MVTIPASGLPESQLSVYFVLELTFGGRAEKVGQKQDNLILQVILGRKRKEIKVVVEVFVAAREC